MPALALARSSWPAGQLKAGNPPALNNVQRLPLAAVAGASGLLPRA
jgi:hypothetical protein